MNWLVTNKEFVIMIVTSLGIAVILDNVFNRLVRQVVTKRVVQIIFFICFFIGVYLFSFYRQQEIVYRIGQGIQAASIFLISGSRKYKHLN